MFFWKRKKKEPDFESKMGELNTTVLSKKDYKNTGKIEQYVVDIAEYLDTHPVDAEAICYFNHHIEMRRNAMQVYADKFGPLTIDTANPDAYWDWAKQPLPWEGGGC